MISEV